MEFNESNLSQENNCQLDSSTGTDLAICEYGGPPIREIALVNIGINDSIQARLQTREDVVDDYAEAMRNGAVFPPLTVYLERDTYLLADGLHRYRAAERAGQTNFRCEVRRGGLRDAILFAAGANATHGCPRSKKDKRRAVLKLLNDDEWRRWADREIARLCNVSHQLVAKLRQVTGPATSERTCRNKHGGKRKMNVKNIGKSPHRAHLPPRRLQRSHRP
jgi:hypothetical protein